MALTAAMSRRGALGREALELHSELGDAWGAAFSRLVVGLRHRAGRRLAGRQQLFGESLRQFRELGDEHYALRAARAHAWAYFEGGDLERARELYEEIIRQARKTHDAFPGDSAGHARQHRRP